MIGMRRRGQGASSARRSDHHNPRRAGRAAPKDDRGAEMKGLYLEEFEVGRKFEHGLRRTVTEMDNTLFSCLTHNPQPLHIDHDFAAKSEWGKPLVNSLFTLGLMIGVSVNDTTLGTTIGNLGMTEVRFPKPVFHGDTRSEEHTSEL